MSGDADTPATGDDRLENLHVRLPFDLRRTGPTVTLVSGVPGP